MDTQNVLHSSKLRIMIVEDEPDIAAILTQVLAPEYEVVHALNGLEALNRLNWYQPDIVIMDLMMPVLDGIDTTRAIKKDNEYAAMPVLFLTARNDNQSVREALMAGGNVYLEKPFAPPELLEHLKKIIDTDKLLPRPKQYSIQAVKGYIASGTDPQDMPEVEEPATVPGSSLSEQLIQAVAQPRARVLVIHPSDQALRLVRHRLNDRYEMITSSDPEAALDKIMAYQPDILVLSDPMPLFHPEHYRKLLGTNAHLQVNHHATLRRISTENGENANPDIVQLMKDLDEMTSSPRFRRSRKRIDYPEIQRREDPEEANT